jgi:NadR type nicotinamide-nucleotide adenylyltransferase
MPPHTGHQYLIEFARAYTEEVTVFVCTLSTEPIAGDLRFAWMTRLFPDVHLVHVTEEIPQASRSQAGAYSIWAQAIRDRLHADPRYVFASEAYGADLAAALGAEFVPVDPQRHVFPVSAGMIRSNPYEHWRFIPHLVRPYFVRRIAVIDSSGELVPELAAAYETVFATDYPAYMRSLRLEGPLDHAAPALARSQAASEEALLRHANRVLFSPADALRILTDAGLPVPERNEVMRRLLADYPYLTPSLVVAADPVSEAYRRAAREHDWPLVETHDRESARERIVNELDRFLTEN